MEAHHSGGWNEFYRLAVITNVECTRRDHIDENEPRATIDWPSSAAAARRQASMAAMRDTSCCIVVFELYRNRGIRRSLSATHRREVAEEAISRNEHFLIQKQSAYRAGFGIADHSGAGRNMNFADDIRNLYREFGGDAATYQTFTQSIPRAAGVVDPNTSPTASPDPTSETGAPRSIVQQIAGPVGPLERADGSISAPGTPSNA